MNHPIPSRIVMDTNILASAMIGTGPAHQAIAACLLRQAIPLVGSTLMTEYESVLYRPELEARYKLTPAEREALLDDFLGVCHWQPVYFTWRPNLPDEGDNHVLELAFAGDADVIVTTNTKDFRGGELRFPRPRVLKPYDWLQELYRDHPHP